MRRNPQERLLIAAFVAAFAIGGTGAARAADGAWQPFGLVGSPEPYLDPIAFDPSRNLLYVYAVQQMDRVWAMNPGDPVGWSSFAVTGMNPYGYSGPMMYDEAHDRLVLLDGYQSDTDMNVYTLDLQGSHAWQLNVPPDGPRPREHEAVIYDPVRHRLILYGGASTFGSYAVLDDAWALDLSEAGMKWERLAGYGPQDTREYPQAIYDPIGRRMVVHGGKGIAEDPRSDVWALSLDDPIEWTQIAPSGSGPERWQAASTYDPANHRMLVFGGQGLSAGPGSPLAAKDDTWSFSLDTGQWTAVPAGTGPGARWHAQGATDDAGRFVIYGGFGPQRLNDVWALGSSSGSQWSLLHADGAMLDARRDAVLAFDPVRRRAILTGGTTANGVSFQTWVTSSDGLRYEPLSTFNQGLAYRSGGAGVWDSARGRLLVFGGASGAPSKDVVALDPATNVWTTVAVSLTPQPSARQWASGAYDAARDRALFFAGYPLANARNQVWALSLAGSPSWTLLAPGGTAPTQRYGHSFTADVGRDRMILFGGGDGGVVTNDLYVLSLAGAGTWTQLVGPGTPPPKRTFHGAIYDPARDRLLVWGGQGELGAWLNDTWEYRFDGTGWRQLALDTSPPGAKAAATYDPLLHRMLIFGGETVVGLADESWALDLPGQTTGVPAGTAGTASLVLHGAIPNPTFAAPRIAFTLPDASPARLELIDLAGRRVRAADVGVLGAGRHVVDFGSGAAIAPGLYFARLTRGSEMRIARVCVVK